MSHTERERERGTNKQPHEQTKQQQVERKKQSTSKTKRNERINEERERNSWAETAEKAVEQDMDKYREQ